MGKPYRLSALAEADLEEIWLYTLKHWSMEQADTYHHKLVAAFEGLAAGTKQGCPVDVLPAIHEVPVRRARDLFSGLPRPSGRDSRPASAAGR